MKTELDLETELIIGNGYRKLEKYFITREILGWFSLLEPHQRKDILIYVAKKLDIGMFLFKDGK